MKKSNKKELREICNRIYNVENSLNGLASLLEQTNPHGSCFDQDDLFGVGQILRSSSQELSSLEDILRCNLDEMSYFEDKRNKSEKRK